MASVNYNKKVVSDESIRMVLQRIADVLGKDLNVTSGDRDFVPEGGAKDSPHLHRRAADFHVDGEKNEKGFKKALEKIIANRDTIFDPDKKYRLIRHGEFTVTTGPHLHLGRDASGQGVLFVVEGLTRAGRGKYRPVESTATHIRAVPFLAQGSSRIPGPVTSITELPENRGPVGLADGLRTAALGLLV